MDGYSKGAFKIDALGLTLRAVKTAPTAEIKHANIANNKIHTILKSNYDVMETKIFTTGRFAYSDLYEETPDTLTNLFEFEKFNLVWDSAMGIDNGYYDSDHGIAYSATIERSF